MMAEFMARLDAADVGSLFWASVIWLITIWALWVVAHMQPEGQGRRSSGKSQGMSTEINRRAN